MNSEIYKIEIQKNNGESISLNNYKNKVFLVVNVAPRCGVTLQHQELESLYTKYKGDDFEILGFPSSEFASNVKAEEADSYDYSFPVFQKTSVKGENQHELYKLLTSKAPESLGKFYSSAKKAFALHNIESGNANDVMWNFEKFLVSKEGDILERFASEISPYDSRLIEAIERELKKS